MNIADRLTLEIGKAALAKMTLAEALETGHGIGYDEGYSDGEQRAESLAQAAQPVGGDIIAERMAKPALSAILPRRPDDVPAPPDGLDYVGFGCLANYKAQSETEIFRCEFDGCWAGRSRGDAPDMHYAIRRTAPPDIWHRFGLLAPEEGGGFYPHTPGDPCPCDGDMRVEVVLSGESPGYIDFSARPGRDWAWVRPGRAWAWGRGGDIIGWRPALEGGGK